MSQLKSGSAHILLTVEKNFTNQLVYFITDLGYQTYYIQTLINEANKICHPTSHSLKTSPNFPFVKRLNRVIYLICYLTNRQVNSTIQIRPQNHIYDRSSFQKKNLNHFQNFNYVLKRHMYSLQRKISNWICGRFGRFYFIATINLLRYVF